MTNNIITFNFNAHTVRTQSINGNAWFCLPDACAALGLSNSRKSKTQLVAKGVTESYTPTNGGKQAVTFINEPNLYRLIFRSNKPQAQAFADWVYDEVLPSIRKTGTYSVATDKPVTVAEHQRALPSGKREIVLSEKAKAEIGGIVKACLGTSKAGTPLGADAFKQLVKEAVAEFFFEQAAEDGENHPSGRPFANWAVTAVHSVGAMQSEYHALRDKMQQAQNLLAAK